MAQRPPHGAQGPPMPRGNFKLIVDPQLKKGQQKLVRFNGDTYSTENHGQGPLVVRDPRPRTSRLWAKRERVELPVPRYKIDDNYIGAIPPREITFSKLNDNITKQFIEQLCCKFGKLERVRVYYHPKTNKHMGLAKVVFASIKSASQCIENLHQTSIMGNVISAVIDSKGEVLKRLHHKILKGELIAETMPDVIRHTQEKPIPRPDARTGRRKSSNDDPRRRQSTDSLPDHPTSSLSHSLSTSSGPKTPPMMGHNEGPQTPPADVLHSRDQPPAFLQNQSMVEEQQFHPFNHQPQRKLSQPTQKHPHHPTPALRIPAQHFAPRDQKNAQSLESGYGSHPNSATLLPEQGSPGLGGDSGSDYPGSSLFESSRKSVGSSDHLTREVSMEEPRKKHKKKHKKKKKREESHHRSSDQDSDADVSQKPTWANDLENRIDLLLSEQNEKFNLKETRHRGRSKIERRGSETSQKSSSNEHYPSNDRHHSHKHERGRQKKLSSEDREDGECSGDDQGSSTSVDVTIVNEVPSKRVSQVDSDSDHGLVSPGLRPDVREEIKRVRTPSPRPHFPPSPPPMMEPHRHTIDRHGEIHGGRRSPEFHRPPHDAYRFGNFHRPGSPGRRSPGFIDHRGFHPPNFEPRFDHRRRSPSFDHRPRGRSPGFDHRPHRHHSPPFRGRPPSPGFVRRHGIPPDHPDYHHHGFNHHRRSISPPQRRFGSPGMHRSFDDNPHRDRFIPHHSPPGIHRRGPSPPLMDPLRRDRRSPSFHRGGFRHPSPEQRRLRDHRELPPEFLERQKLRRSVSPDSSRGAHSLSRMDVDSPHHHHHFLDANGRMRQRSRSSSPSILQRTPPRIRSPVPVRQDQRPYSPGDLRIGDSIPSGPDIIPSSATDFTESDVAGERIKPGKRAQRESSDQDPPQISLDERLREITGEPPPEPEPPSPTQDNSEKSPSGSLDMEISSGSGGPPSPCMAPGMNHPYGSAGFRPPFQGVPQHQGQWGFGREMWNGYDPRMSVPGHPQMWGGVRPDHPHFHPRPGQPNGFPPHVGFPHADVHRGEHPFDPNMLPPPPPGWNRPWVQVGQPQHPSQMGSMAPHNFLLNDGNEGDKFIDNCVLNRISGELKEIIKKDLNRKMIETMAFRVYESWWDSQNVAKNPKPLSAPKPTAVSTTTELPKTEADKENIDKSNNTKPPGKLPTLLNTFDPLNWAKGSLEMDGFRIGLGLRSAISKMPSFRVKKRTPSPQPVPSKKMKMAEINRNKMAENKRQSRKASQVGKKRRVYLDSGGEDEDASDVDSSDVDEEDRNKMGRVPLDVDDVFSSSESSSSEEEEESDDEEDEEDVEDSEDDKETEKEEDSDKEEIASTKKLIKQERFDEDVEASRASKRSFTKEQELIGPPKKRARSDLEIKLESSDAERVTKAALSLSEMKSTSPLVSPTAPTGGSLTPQDLKHVHPKKRYRLLSKEETSNLDLIAEVSGRRQSTDEISAMNDKEKAALEILTDMKATPERFLSSTTSSDSSEQPLHPPTPGRQLSGSVFSPPATPNVPRRASVTTDNLHPLDSHVPDTPGRRKTALPSVEDARKSGSEELEAVEALLSIKQSQPPLPPLSPSPGKSKQKEEKRKVMKTQVFVPPKRLVSMETCDRVLQIAEEHNYFATSPRNNRDHYDVTLDRVTQEVFKEHSYSYSPLRYAAHALAQGPTSIFDTDTATFTELSAAEISAASAAERVKLRRESKDKKKSRSKSRLPLPLLDERRVAPTVKFKQRSELEEMSVLYLMWGMGLDLEDMKLLRAEYEEMLKLGSVPWVNETHWVAHPITNIPDPDADARSQERRGRSRRAKKQENLTTKNHKTGCARSEGYYKLTDTSKLIQRRLMYRQADNAIKPGSRKGLEPSSTPATNLATEKSREARHMMRRIASEFGSDVSDLLKYNQLMFRKKSVKFARSSIHGWGLFAQETIGADEMVIEYVGELVRSSVADRREVVYTKRGIGSSYLFRIDSDHIIDATKCGNYARFMNHSCNPSCYAKVITVDGAKKIVIYSKDVIKPQDEITYDYKFPLEDIKIPCFCGAPTCRGTLN